MLFNLIFERIKCGLLGRLVKASDFFVILEVVPSSILSENILFSAVFCLVIGPVTLGHKFYSPSYWAGTACGRDNKTYGFSSSGGFLLSGRKNKFLAQNGFELPTHHQLSFTQPTWPRRPFY